MSEAQVKAKRVEVITGVRIECEPPTHLSRNGFWRPWKTEAERIEYYAKHLEDWVNEFHDFIRNHRSQDPVSLSVVREKQQCCSACRNAWEVMAGDGDDVGKTVCASCGVEVE